MKERPILFSGPMVRAILEPRKTQTRRVIKSQPPYPCIYPTLTQRGWIFTDGSTKEAATHPRRGYMQCPYGVPGDRLWVKETFRDPDTLEYLIYKADENTGEWPDYINPLNLRWKPSIFMSRRYSRLTLEITAVRVERVQDISEADAIAEGVKALDGNFHGCYMFGDRLSGTTAKECFSRGWDSINASRGYGWDANPWVWVVEFKRLEVR